MRVSIGPRQVWKSSVPERRQRWAAALAGTGFCLLILLFHCESRGRDYVLGELELPSSPEDLEWFLCDGVLMHRQDAPEAMRRLHALLKTPLTHLSGDTRATAGSEPFAVGLRDGRALVGDVVWLRTARASQDFWRWLSRPHAVDRCLPVFGREDEHLGPPGEWRRVLVTPRATIDAKVQSVAVMDRGVLLRPVEPSFAAITGRWLQFVRPEQIEVLVQGVARHLPRYVVGSGKADLSDVSGLHAREGVAVSVDLAQPISVAFYTVPWNPDWGMCDHERATLTVQSYEIRPKPMSVRKIVILFLEGAPAKAALAYRSEEDHRWWSAGVVPADVAALQVHTFGDDVHR